MITAALGLDPAAAGALAALIISAVASVAGARYGGRKTTAETESIATRTTLEVNEALREELKESRREAAELREALGKRNEELETLHRRVSGLRHEVDILEAQINALRGSTAP